MQAPKPQPGSATLPLFNTPTTYGSLTRSLHWITALLIMANIGLGFAASWAPFNSAEALAQKTWLFSLHKTLGVTLFFVALLRVVLGVAQSRPLAMSPVHKVEALTAHTVHWLLYALLVLVPLTGWVHHAATDGFAPILWPLGQNLPLIPKSQFVFETAGALHVACVVLLIATVVLHILGALKHAVIDRDGTLKRMLTGTPRAAPRNESNQGILPGLAAVIVLAVTVFLGWTTDPTESQRKDRAALQSNQTSSWIVTEGALNITVRQLGAQVAGSFETWTADIDFAVPQGSGPAGQVGVTIDVASLKLGAVSAQALGPDFFDVERFPTARFQADLNATDENYVADGTLTIKDISKPIRMPFVMQVQDGTAQMTASLVLRRDDFNIGLNFTDESQLGYDVIVDIAITAQAAP